MTKDDFLKTVLVALRSAPVEVQRSAEIILPGAVDFVLHRHQWDFRTVSKSITAQTPDDETYANFPAECDKEIALFHSDVESDLVYITPKEYAKELADNDQSGDECRKYTVQGDGKGGRRFYFWPPTSGNKTITLHFSIILPGDIFEKLNEHFYNAIRTEILFRLGQPFAKSGEWSNYGVLKDARDQAFDDLVSYFEAQGGRLKRVRLHPSLGRSTLYQHK